MVPSDLPAPLALRPRAAAAALGISTRTLWEWTKRGLIPCAKIGTGRRKVVIYNLAELQAWLARQTAAKEGGQQ